jgi:hypothetical protein
MPTEIRWKPSLSATCMHAAACRQAGMEAADSQLAAALEASIDALVGEMTDAQWPVDDMLGQFVVLASEYDNNRELVTRALSRISIHGDEYFVGRVAGAIADVEAALRRAHPEVVEELAVRGRPMREQWEARGPGMLIELARLTDAAVVPESAEIVLVAPYAGGYGWAHASQNRVTLEAVLVNPLPELPEAVRMAWLVGQLNGDLPRFADSLPAGRGAAAFGLAMLAPTLAAAETVELSRCDEEMLAVALDAWRLGFSGAGGDLPADAASRIWQWWNTWLDRSKKWAVAVAALDGLMQGDA